MSHASETPNRQRPLVAAIVGTVVIMAYALFAAVQILVLNPLAAVPGASLRDIYAHVAEAGDSMGVLVVLASLAVGPGIAIALLVAVWSGPATSVRRVALAPAQRGQQHPRAPGRAQPPGVAGPGTRRPPARGLRGDLRGVSL